MEYILSFLEGILTFISPCLLPMLPVYICYFAGEGEKENKTRTLVNALGFVLGFTLVFVLMGAFSAAIGGLLFRYQTTLQVLTGAVVVLFGLSILGALPFSLITGGRTGGRRISINGFLSAFVFGVVFSVSWTPCVGAFLGSALMMASRSGSALRGILMLLCYSAGLGIPFVLSAVLLDRIRGALDLIKRHYSVITKLSGLFLIAAGIMMMTGVFGYLLTLLSFYSG